MLFPILQKNLCFFLQDTPRMSSFKQLKERRDARASTSSFYTSSAAAPRHVAPKPKDELNQDASSSLSPVQKSVPPSSTTLPPQVRLEANPDLHVRDTKGKGRGLFWSPADARRVGRGTTLLRIEPEMTVPSSEKLKSMCHRCYSISEDGKVLQRCSGCKVLRYCSITCQKADWQSHRQECKALQAFKSKSRGSDGNGVVVEEPGTTLRLMGRLIWERKRLGDGWWKRIETLEANRKAISSDQNLVELPIKLAIYLGINKNENGEQRMEELGFSNAAELLDLIGRTILNTFTTYSSDLTAVGMALSSSVAMINHSCSPNVAIVYPNGPGAKNAMHVVALKDLEPGDELSTFYIDVSEPYLNRQKTLEQHYYFKCSCTLCTKAEKTMQGKKSRVEAREALWCGRAGCSGWVALPHEGRGGRGGGTSICTKCKLSSTLNADEASAALEEGREVLKKVDELMSEGNMKEALKSARSTVKNLTQIQPPSSYPLLTLLRQLQTALVLCATSTNNTQEASEHFEEAIRFHFLSIAGMQASSGEVFCEGHPSRAIALATLSALLVREISEEEAGWIASAGASSSSFLSKVPSIPPVGAMRDQSGITLMIQAIKELKIAYGNEEEGGEPGRKLIDQVREWKESQAISSSVYRNASGIN